jgi:hypothetical protein
MLRFKSTPIIPIKIIIGLVLCGILILLILRLKLLVISAPSLVLSSLSVVVGWGWSGGGGVARDAHAVLRWLGCVGTRVVGEGAWVGCGTMMMLARGARRVAAVALAGGSLAAEAVEWGAAVKVG